MPKDMSFPQLLRPKIYKENPKPKYLPALITIKAHVFIKSHMTQNVSPIGMSVLSAFSRRVKHLVIQSKVVEIKTKN